MCSLWLKQTSFEQVNDDVKQSATSSSASCTIVEADCVRVNSLREWIASRGYASLDMVQNSQEDSSDQKLSDVKSGSFFNITCQVTSYISSNDLLSNNNWKMKRFWRHKISQHWRSVLICLSLFMAMFTLHSMMIDKY